jgi:hypothetical protein
MLMADTMAVFFVVLGLMLSFVGLWLLTRGLWPARVDAAAERLDRGLVIPFLVGLPIAAVAVVAAAAATALPGKLGGLTTGLIVCAFVTYAHTGVSGLATAIGRRLPSAVDDASPWRRTLRGGVVLVLAYLAPILGWFAILPISTVVGAGATTLGLFAGRRRAVAAAPQPVPVFRESPVDAVRG